MHSGTDFRFVAVFLGFFLSMFVFQNSSLADVIPRIEIPSSLNPVGSGARALGMGEGIYCCRRRCHCNFLESGRAHPIGDP